MGNNKLILFFYVSFFWGLNLGIHFMIIGQIKSPQQILSELTNEGEILGFVENCKDKNLWTKIPIIPPILTSKLKISSKFGYRLHPIDHEIKFHSGIDLIAFTDTIIVSADGVVELVDYQKGLGLFVVIRHEYGFMSLCGHLNAVFVKSNQVVKVAQPIGLMGNTGK